MSEIQLKCACLLATHLFPILSKTRVMEEKTSLGAKGTFCSVDDPEEQTTNQQGARGRSNAHRMNLPEGLKPTRLTVCQV